MSNESETLAYYRDLIKKYPVLKKQDELKLARKAKRGDKAAVDLLVKHNIGIVLALANRLRVRSIPMEDLIQEGMAGFVHAIHQFEPKRNLRLSTYASWWVNAMILKYLKINSGPVRLPATKRKDGEQLRLPVSVSMSTPIGENGDSELIDLFADTAPLADEEFDVRARRHDINSAIRSMSGLGKIGRDIVRDRLMKDEPETLQQIGERHGLSRERIRQLEIGVKDQLKKRLIDYAA